MINWQKSVFEVGSATRNINYMFLSVLETQFFYDGMENLSWGMLLRK